MLHTNCEASREKPGLAVIFLLAIQTGMRFKPRRFLTAFKLAQPLLKANL
jgi:hypothetical protein